MSYSHIMEENNLQLYLQLLKSRLLIITLSNEIISYSHNLINQQLCFNIFAIKNKIIIGVGIGQIMQNI